MKNCYQHLYWIFCCLHLFTTVQAHCLPGSATSARVVTTATLEGFEVPHYFTAAAVNSSTAVEADCHGHSTGTD